jgi:hypothetical protein
MSSGEATAYLNAAPSLQIPARQANHLEATESSQPNCASLSMMLITAFFTSATVKRCKSSFEGLARFATRSA